MKTRAAQILEKLGLAYEVREFHDQELSADEVAEQLNIPLAQVFKTLVVRGDRTGVILACIPGTMTLSLKTLARLSGNGKVEMVEKDEIHRLTGYLRGGVSPLGGRRPIRCIWTRARWSTLSSASAPACAGCNCS